MSTSIGMMDPAYFVGRKEILDWLNGYLGLSLSKVEETCTGAVACQLLDSLFPGKVPMSKVNWDARSDAEYISNYKVLQSAFDRLNIQKNIDVQRLTRGKYMDNLEFMQWFKNFHDTTGAVDGYDAFERRSKGKGGAKYGASAGARRPQASGSARTSRPAAAMGGGSASGAATAAGRSGAGGATKPRSAASSRAPTTAGASASSAAAPAPDPQLAMKVQSLTEEREELLSTMTAVEKERDFYFDKLREIELLLQSHEQEAGESELTKNAFKILYATDDDHEAPGADGAQEPLPGAGGQVGGAEPEDLLADDDEVPGRAEQY